MSTDIRPIVDELRRRYDELCFACGRDNPVGLGIEDFHIEGEDVSAGFTPRAHYRGTEGVLHGGIGATAVDEILVWAGILQHRVMSVTARLEMRYPHPAPVDRELALRGRVLERRGRRMIATGELMSGDRVVAKGRGLLLVTEDLSELFDSTDQAPFDQTGSD